jgi:hypothetical protein
MDTPIPEAYWVKPGLLLAGPYPGSRWQPTESKKLQLLLDGGVKLFLDLTEKNDAPPYTAWLGGRARHLRMPISDFDVPTADTMIRILDELDRAIWQNRCVYVHCLAGLGRTGTVIGCYLARHGTVGIDALKKLENLRADSLFARSRSPETDPQHRMVLRWKAGQ